MKQRLTAALQVAAVLCVAIVLGVLVDRLTDRTRPTWQVERDRALARADSASRSAARAQSQLRAADSLAAVRGAAADSLARRAIELAHVADVSRRDARAALAEARDSSVHLEVVRHRYERAITMYEGTVDSLEAAVGLERARGDTLTLTVAELRAAAIAADSAIARVVPASQALAGLVRASEPSCRLAFGVPCPSRRVVAVGGLVLGLVGGALAR